MDRIAHYKDTETGKLYHSLQTRKSKKKKKKPHVGANDEYKQQKFKDLHPLPHPPSSTHTFPFLFYMERIMLCK